MDGSNDGVNANLVLCDWPNFRYPPLILPLVLILGGVQTNIPLYTYRYNWFCLRQAAKNLSGGVAGLVKVALVEQYLTIFVQHFWKASSALDVA